MVEEICCDVCCFRRGCLLQRALEDQLSALLGQLQVHVWDCAPLQL